MSRQKSYHAHHHHMSVLFFARIIFYEVFVLLTVNLTSCFNVNFCVLRLLFLFNLFFNCWNSFFLCSAFLFSSPILFLKSWLYLLLLLLWRSHSRSGRITLRSPWSFFRRNDFKFILLNHWNKCEELASIQTKVIQLKIKAVWQTICCILRNWSPRSGESRGLNLSYCVARPFWPEGAPLFPGNWQN